MWTPDLVPVDIPEPSIISLEAIIKATKSQRRPKRQMRTGISLRIGLDFLWWLTDPSLTDISGHSARNFPCLELVLDRSYSLCMIMLHTSMCQIVLPRLTKICSHKKVGVS